MLPEGGEESRVVAVSFFPFHIFSLVTSRMLSVFSLPFFSRVYPLLYELSSLVFLVSLPSVLVDKIVVSWLPRRVV